MKNTIDHLLPPFFNRKDDKQFLKELKMLDVLHYLKLGTEEI